jgi:hypothetical protein
VHLYGRYTILYFYRNTIHSSRQHAIWWTLMLKRLSLFGAVDKATNLNLEGLRFHLWPSHHFILSTECYIVIPALCGISGWATAILFIFAQIYNCKHCLIYVGKMYWPALKCILLIIYYRYRNETTKSLGFSGRRPQDSNEGDYRSEIENG